MLLRRVLSNNTDAKGPRLLYIDRHLPLPRYGSGCSRANAIMRTLLDAGWQVTCFSIKKTKESNAIVRADIPSSVKVIRKGRKWTLLYFLIGRIFTFNIILISRRNSLLRFAGILKWLKKKNSNCKIIFDFESLTPLGEKSRRELAGIETREEAERIIRDQIAEVSWIDGVICHSEGDARELRRLGRPDAIDVGYLHDSLPTTAEFSSRKDMLFVGRLAEENAPNSKGLCWFVSEVWPVIAKRLGSEVRLIVAGIATAKRVRAIKSSSVIFLGPVPDLHPLYNSTKVFVAANLVSFGVPVKVLEAAAHGIPVVTTQEINSYLEWRNGEEILCSDDPLAFAEACIRLYEDSSLWNRVRVGALAKINPVNGRKKFIDLVNQLALKSNASSL